MDIILTLLAVFPSLLQSAGESDSSQTTSVPVIEIQMEMDDDSFKLNELNEESFKIVGLV